MLELEFLRYPQTTFLKTLMPDRLGFTLLVYTGVVAKILCRTEENSKHDI